MTEPGVTPPHHVTRGGEPSSEQAVAIAAAVTEFVRVAEVEAAQAAQHPAEPAWTRAALTEGTTRVTVRTPNDLPAAHPAPPTHATSPAPAAPAAPATPPAETRATSTERR